jgi:outer membrane immunogenic protein
MRSVVMRRLIVLAIAALTAASPAFAVDLTRAPAPAAPVPFSWTGCSIGGHFGFDVSDDRTTGPLGRSISFSSMGFVGGGQIGCDYQFAPRWVVGVEGQAAWTNLKKTYAGTVRNFATGVTLPSHDTLRNDFLASLTPRLGYSIIDQVLVFAKGGAAWTDEKYDIAFTNEQGIAVDPGAARTRTGWTVGAGLEWAFAPHWSSTLEYEYYNFGNSGILLTDPHAIVTVASLKDQINTVTLGVNYHF